MKIFKKLKNNNYICYIKNFNCFVITTACNYIRNYWIK